MLFIDEVSLVGAKFLSEWAGESTGGRLGRPCAVPFIAKFLAAIDQRMRVFLGKWMFPFGGVHVFLVGDLLKPTSVSWDFQGVHRGLQALAPSPWSRVRMFELTQVREIT